MRDAYVALSNLKERTGREAILDKYKTLMAEKYVRTEPLGSDRHGRRYWVFEGDSRCGAPLPDGFKTKRYLFRLISGVE